MQTLHVRFYTDSLGLPRLDCVEYKRTYVELLISYFHEKKIELEVVKSTIGASNIRTITKQLGIDNFYYSNQIDIAVVQIGIVDCAPRPVPEFVRKIIGRLPPFIKERVISFISNNRRAILNAGFRYFITSKKDFDKCTGEFLKKLLSQSKQIFVIGICPTNNYFDHKSPGFQKSIEDYNAIWKLNIAKHSLDNIVFLDMIEAIGNSQSIDEYIIRNDGHHITEKAHNLIFNLIKNKIKLN